MCNMCDYMKRVVNYDDACIWDTISNDDLNCVLYEQEPIARMSRRKIHCSFLHQVPSNICNEVQRNEVDRVFAQYEQNECQQWKDEKTFILALLSFVISIQIDCNNVFVQFIASLYHLFQRTLDVMLQSWHDSASFNSTRRNGMIWWKTRKREVNHARRRRVSHARTIYSIKRCTV